MFGGFPFPEVDDKDNPHYKGNMDPMAVGLIRKLCKATGANIVLHSSWRNHVDTWEFGVVWGLPIIDRTECYIEKARSIKEWLTNHPEVKIYAIVDDDDMNDKEHQVETTTYDGLRFRDYERLKAMLSQKE